MKRPLSVVILMFLLSSACFASSWIDTCDTGVHALAYARSEIENEEFSTDLCSRKSKKGCLVYFTNLSATATTVYHTVKLQAVSGNYYEFEVKEGMRFIADKNDRNCSKQNVKLTRFY